jgi:hypothetical protein
MNWKIRHSVGGEFIISVTDTDQWRSWICDTAAGNISFARRE